MAVIDQSLQDQLQVQLGTKKATVSDYNPTKEERDIRGLILKHFAQAYTTMYKPRVEFSDLSTIGRDQVDYLAFNTYQPNNGNAYPGDQVNGWRSNAIRPIERNKAISIASHVTSQILYPKIFAFDQDSNLQAEAAEVLEDLMEWAGDHSDYAYTALQAVIQALVAPASIVYSEYVQVHRTVKREKMAGGKYRTEQILDETLSGFRDYMVPVDQLFIENFFEPDLQKQGWLIWRRVQDHTMMQQKYGHLPNFKFVQPGMQCLFNDANQGFYYIYDPEMRETMDEEVIYFNRTLDVRLVTLNGVLVTAPDESNPRQDKLYPFSKFGYELIDMRCFYYKSLVFKVSRDANIINTIYPMVIDGTYLNIMPPFTQTGGEIIGSDVIVPGLVTTLSDPSSTLNPIKMASDIKSGLDMLMKVEDSLNQTSDTSITSQNGNQQTAYAISKMEQERNAQLGLFVQMIANFVRQYGKLRLGDILQHLTVADADKITDDPGLVYKSFLVNKKSRGKNKTRKIKFDSSLPGGAITPEQKLQESYKTLDSQGGSATEMELYRVNPDVIRDLIYSVICSPDTLAPRSEDVERMYGLEIYDRAINNPVVDQEEVARDFLFGKYRESQKDPDKYLQKQQSTGMMGGNQMPSTFQRPGQQMPPMGQAGQAPQQSPLTQLMPQ